MEQSHLALTIRRQDKHMCVIKTVPLFGKYADDVLPNKFWSFFQGSLSGRLESTARHLMEIGYTQQLTFKLVSALKPFSMAFLRIEMKIRD
jgi:hypothetical protein